MENKIRRGEVMAIELVVSIVAICGFAIALTYNVYEFRKVGGHLDALTGEHTKMIKHLDALTGQHERVTKHLDALTEGQKQIVSALRAISAPKGRVVRSQQNEK